MSFLSNISTKLLHNPNIVAIDIIDETNNIKIGKNMQIVNFKPFSTLEEYLKDLHLTKGTNRVFLQEKKRNSSTGFMNVGNPFRVNLSTNEETETERITKGAYTSSTTSNEKPSFQPQTNRIESTQAHFTPPFPQQNILGYFSGGSGLNGGLNAQMMEVAELLSTRKKLETIEDDHRKLKNEHDDLKRDLRKAEIKNSELESSLRTAEKEKELAVRMEQIDKKGFGDSEFAKKIPEMLTGLAPLLMKNAGGYMPQQTQGLGGAENISETKNQFVEFIIQDQLTDAFIEQVYKVSNLMASNQQFATELNMIMSKYNKY